MVSTTDSTTNPTMTTRTAKIRGKKVAQGKTPPSKQREIIVLTAATRSTVIMVNNRGGWLSKATSSNNQGMNESQRADCIPR